jgi:hypothetical protein
VAGVATGVAVASSHSHGLDPSKVCGGPCDVTVNP